MFFIPKAPSILLLLSTIILIHSFHYSTNNIPLSIFNSSPMDGSHSKLLAILKSITVQIPPYSQIFACV